MGSWLQRKPVLWLSLGLAMGLLVGVGMFAGALVVTGLHRPLARGPMEFPLYASASHGGDGFAMATGNIDEDVDGLYTLDFLTGDLMCWVFNPRTLILQGCHLTIYLD